MHSAAFHTEDTIVAPASAPGGGLRGIVRICGPATVEVLRGCFLAENGADPAAAGRAVVIEGTVHVEAMGRRLPCDLHWWPDERSYTAQPTAELHTIGSPPLIDAVVEEVCRHDARLARPGEFTLRAFLAGRLDLTQAEAVLGVIDARGQSQLQTALGQLAGGLSGPLSTLREELLTLLAHLEAGLDFVEEDIEFISTEDLVNQVTAIRQRVAEILDQMQTRGSADELPRVVLVGRPNAGKSSLLNALSGSDSAIVSEQAGTTRDYVSRQATLGGIDCLLVDTAGVAERQLDAVDGAAQAVAGEQARQADLLLACVDSTTTQAGDWPAAGSAVPRLTVLTKCDLANRPSSSDDWVATSSLTGQGIDRLAGRIGEFLTAAGGADAVVANTAVRCRSSLQQAGDALDRALAAAQNQLGEELVAAELRDSLRRLGEVVGAVVTDDVLDRIFSRFCIGK